MPISTLINLAAATGACFAAYYTAVNAKVTQEALKIALKSRNDNVRPVLDFRRAEHAHTIGKHINSAGQLTSAFYQFEVMNVGQGSAVLGDNPFRQVPILEVISRELSHDPIRGKMTVIPEDFPLKNTLRPGEVMNLSFGAGQFGNRPMGNVFELQPMYYTDVLGRQYETRVSIRADAGDVIGITTNIIEERSNSNENLEL